MGIDSPLLLLAPILFYGAGIFIARLAFSIPTKIKILKAQTKLLAEIAKKQGIEPEKIESIISEMNW